MKFNALFLMLLLSVYPPFAQSQQDELTRTQFATKMARILAGTNQRQVVEQLGLPDIKMTTVNKQPLQLPAAARALGASEYWYYGTNELSDFPTLGQVYFDSNRNVIGTFGGSGSPIKTETISENIVQNTLRLINSMPPADGSNWDPIVASRVTNSCLDLGNDPAMAVIEEFVRVSPPSLEMNQQVALLLCLLHDVPQPAGYFPEFQLGVAVYGAPKDRRLIPRYPLHLLSDEIPVLMANGYHYAGPTPTDTREIIDWFRLNGVWRTTRLSAPKLSVKQLDELQSEVLDLAEQYLDSSRARLTTKNVQFQLEKLSAKTATVETLPGAAFDR